MATNTPTITVATDTFTEFKDNVNTISLDLGATGRLNTSQDSDVVGAINEIEAVFDASEKLITSDSDLTVNVDSGDVIFTDNSTEFARITNSSGQLVLKSGSNQTVLTASNTDATFNNDLTVENDLQVDNDLTVTGAVNANGNVTLGNASTDTVTVTASLASDITPESDNTVSLGTASHEYKDLYVDGIGFIDGIEADSATVGNFHVIASTISNTNSVTLDLGGDLTIDVDGGDINLEDGTVSFGVLKNSAVTTDNDLTIANNGSDTVSFSKDSADFKGDVVVSGNLRFDGALTTTATNAREAINELDAELGTITAGAMGTTASTVSGAISELEVEIDTLNTFVEPTQSLTTTATTLADAVNELDALQGNTSLTTTATTLTAAVNELDALQGNDSLTTTATTLTGAVNELDSDVGARSSLTTDDKTNVVSAVNELDGLVGTVPDSAGSGNLTASKIGESLRLLDSAVGDLDTLSATDVSVRSNLVAAINSIGADVAQLDSDTTSFDSRVGSLSALDSSFTGSERTSVVNALNALALSIPQIYDESGTLLN
jgi:hypothetical protein